MYAVSIEKGNYSHYLNACLYTYVEPVILSLCTPRRMPRSLLIEHASSMHQHTSVLVQSITHTAIENTSSAYMCAILNAKRHRSFVHMHACMRAILNMCQVATCMYSQV